MLVVITEANDSEWLSPSFLQPKSETNWLPFLGAFKNINMPLQCKLYPMPKISNFFKLEGLNMLRLLIWIWDIIIFNLVKTQVTYVQPFSSGV